MDFIDAAVVSSKGEIVKIFKRVTEELVLANKLPDEHIILGTCHYADSYWDFTLGSFVPIPTAPDDKCVFNYTTKQWEDTRSLDEVKISTWNRIKSLRDLLEFGGFTFEGNVYDSNQVSQGRIMGAALAGVEQPWTLQDNSSLVLSADQLKQLYSAMAQHVAQCHERGRIARQAIEVAQTKEDVEAVVL